MKLTVAATLPFLLSSSGLVSTNGLGCTNRWRRRGVNTPMTSYQEQGNVGMRASRTAEDSTSAVFDSLPEGIWTMRGYGNVLGPDGFDTDSGNFSLYEETQISCILLLEDINLELLAMEMGMSFALSKDGTVLTTTQGINQYLMDKSKTFTGACADGVTPQPGDEGYVHDPAFTLAAMKQWFYEHYAFFDLYYPGGYEAWAKVADSFTSSLDSNTTDEELLSVMEELTAPFDDVVIITNASSDDCECYAPWIEEMFMEYQDLQDANSSYTWDDKYEYLEAQYQIWLNHTLDSVYLDSLKGELGYPLYGKIMDEDGVSCAAGWLGFTDFFNNDELWEPRLIEAMTDLHNCSAMIIDVRIHDGGWDELGLKVTSYLIGEPLHAFSKRAFIRNITDGTAGFTEYSDIMVQPAINTSLHYDGPVIVLTSESTWGAGEVFVLSVLPLPAVTLMGQNTFGTFSDSLAPDLPNGWLAVFSNEEYSSAVDGKVYEMIGIPPDVTLNPPNPLSLQDRQNHTDTWLEAAIQFAANLTAQESPTAVEKAAAPPRMRGLQHR
jgi:carboxyl-terminal processing protease